MTLEFGKYTLLPSEITALGDDLHKFCQSQTGDPTDFEAQFKAEFLTYSKRHEDNRQAMGIWVCQFLALLIARLKSHPGQADHPLFNLGILIANLPYEENSELYKSVAAEMGRDKTLPMAPERYLYLVQMVMLLSELGSIRAAYYMTELNTLLETDLAYSSYLALVQMLKGISEDLAGHHLGEQTAWLELLTRVWHRLDRRQIIFFLAQWMISLHWVRPMMVRKNLLKSLLQATDPDDGQNQAILLYELFNLPFKAHETFEKMEYLTQMKSLPPALFSVSQLQNIYYYSGSVRNLTEAGFMESVADFQQSNYYIHRYWHRIARTSLFLRRHLSREDYLDVISSLELKAQDLINVINIQSNAYVEILQSSYTKINELYHQVEELSLRDTLTGLHNRRFLSNNISEMLLLAIRQQFPISFVIIDIDNFKPINDTHGHAAGDFILAEMSALLKNFFRKSDFVVRYGGEEFLLVLFNSDQDQTETAMENLRQNILTHVFGFQEQELHISISTGIASCNFASPYAEVNLEYIISEADAAMYESKLHGKNQVTSRIFTF